MTNPYVTIWNEPPELAIPESPVILSDSHQLWLAYETTAEPRGQVHAVIHFQHVIEHRLSPINDEGLGQHPYVAAGLKWYSFNEIKDSKETQQWAILQARHWIITFKDVTFDIVAAKADVIARDVRATDPLTALLSIVIQGF